MLGLQVKGEATESKMVQRVNWKFVLVCALGNAMLLRNSVYAVLQLDQTFRFSHWDVQRIK